MNKQQFGYKLGKLCLKLNAFAKQASQQYHISYWVMLPVIYSPIILLLFIFPLLAVLVLVAWLIVKLSDNDSDESQSECVSLISDNSEDRMYTKLAEDDANRHAEYEYFFDDK
ncbi:hypothetical protein [Aggregatibacter actinomycetemcomitans]|uniref:hypothetical protein n=1 Tax=Aggregatibacter actinomycetemcomitans TaxID=714 RepID=UPI0011DDA6D6|nr:hypothetical protein [Aggregatibacter actinomycetemcomitans]QEH46030.1 hypothetical protein FXN58_11210 [Aggregatibacter actinomycetemcomitans]QEH50058.1 hypothetical protein FXN57_11030 [Aggregatibacter actinomycetemcomitans]